MKRLDRCCNFLHRLDHTTCVFNFGQYNHKLVAAVTAHRVVAAQTSNQAVRDGLQESISDVMAQSVVNRLEVIEVRKHHGELVLMAACRDKCLCQPVIK